MSRLPQPMLLATLAALSLGAANAGAQTPYRSRTAFLSALRVSGGDNLDIPPLAEPVTEVLGLTFGFTTASLADPSPNPAFATSTLGPASSGVPGDQSWSVNDGGTTRLRFASSVNGFGARFLGLASVNDVVFRFLAGGAVVGSVTFAREPLSPGYEGFYGLTLGAVFDQLEIVAQAGDYYEMDDLAAGIGLSAVPEPSVLVLIGPAGLALLLAARRRRAPALAPVPAEVTHG